MPERSLTVLSYPVVMGLLMVLTLVLVLLGSWYWKLGISTLYLLAIPIVLAVAYLAWYRTLPYHPPEPRRFAGGLPGAAEPFDDPVEEADRLEEAKDDEEIPEVRDDEEDEDDSTDERARPPEDPDSP